MQIEPEALVAAGLEENPHYDPLRAEKVPKLYIIVNTDLQLTVGRIGVDIGHIVSKLWLKNLLDEKNDDEGMDRWLCTGRVIEVYSATKAQIDTLPAPEIYVRDTGPMVVQSGPCTVVAWMPTDIPIRGIDGLVRLG